MGKICWVLEDEKVLVMGRGDGCTKLWMHLIPLNYILNNGQHVSFYIMYILSKLKIDLKTLKCIFRLLSII